MLAGGGEQVGEFAERAANGEGGCGLAGAIAVGGGEGGLLLQAESGEGFFEIDHAHQAGVGFAGAAFSQPGGLVVFAILRARSWAHCRRQRTAWAYSCPRLGFSYVREFGA